MVKFYDFDFMNENAHKKWAAHYQYYYCEYIYVYVRPSLKPEKKVFVRN